MIEPADHRLAPFMLLRNLIPMPGNDAEAAVERKLARRIDVGKAVRK